MCDGTLDFCLLEDIEDRLHNEASRNIPYAIQRPSCIDKEDPAALPP